MAFQGRTLNFVSAEESAKRREAAEERERRRQQSLAVNAERQKQLVQQHQARGGVRVVLALLLLCVDVVLNAHV